MDALSLGRGGTSISLPVSGLGDLQPRPARGSLPSLPLPPRPPPSPRRAAWRSPRPATARVGASARTQPSEPRQRILGRGLPRPLPSNPSPRRSAFGAGRQSPGARSGDQQPRTPGNRSQQVRGLGDPRARGGGFQRTLGGSQESREITWVLGGWVPGMLCPPPGRQAPKERFAPSLPPPQPPQPQRCREVPLRKRVRRRPLGV